MRSEFVVGMALRVDRTYFGGQLAVSEGVTLDYRQLARTDLNAGQTHIGRKYDWWWWQIKLSDIEWLIQQVGRI